MTRMAFTQIIGTGGIGTGVLFLLDGNRALERNESRPARLSEARDYCKQHIILHYAAKALSGRANVYAIGMVGADAQGRRLKEEMRSAGIDVSMVEESETHPTMYSVCLQYPDASVCNVTTGNSACLLVTETYLRSRLETHEIRADEKTILLAAPEVPVAARLGLLRLGATCGAFRVASLLVDEAEEFIEGGGLALTDLLALNETEASAVAGVKRRDLAERNGDERNAGSFQPTEREEEARSDRTAIERCCARARAANPKIRLVITCGANGSYSYQDGLLEFIPPIETRVVSTAGAGDAYLSGVICGLALGLPFQRGKGNALRATDLGNFFATESVASIHTICETFHQEAVRNYLTLHGGSDYDI